MFVIEVSPDSAVHLATSRIANRMAFLIFPLLRGADDRDVALREASAIAREEIEKLGAAASTCPVVASGNRHARETIRGP
jgi:hypothetical protein